MGTVTIQNLFAEYPDVLSIHDMRRALGIGQAGAYKLLASGIIPSFKIGSTYKIPKSSLIEYVKNQTKGEENT